MIELQHINVKLLLKEQEGIDLAALIPVFHGWIQEQSFDELLIDVADYRHVPDGPGVMVIGNEADYSVDQNEGRLGVRYNRKSILNSNNQARLKQATRAALIAFQRLEEDTRVDQKLRFDGKDVQIFINDRLLAPNNSGSQKSLEPDFRQLADLLFGADGYELIWESDPRRLTGATIKGKQATTIPSLLQNLS